jgi:hypothetical protein
MSRLHAQVMWRHLKPARQLQLVYLCAKPSHAVLHDHVEHVMAVLENVMTVKMSRQCMSYVERLDRSDGIMLM